MDVPIPSVEEQVVDIAIIFMRERAAKKNTLSTGASVGELTTTKASQIGMLGSQRTRTRTKKSKPTTKGAWSPQVSKGSIDMSDSNFKGFGVGCDDG